MRSFSAKTPRVRRLVEHEVERITPSIRVDRPAQTRPGDERAHRSQELRREMLDLRFVDLAVAHHVGKEQCLDGLLAAPNLDFLVLHQSLQRRTVVTVFRCFLGRGQTDDLRHQAAPLPEPDETRRAARPISG